MESPSEIEHLRWRTRARRALEGYFRERSFPRLVLGLLLAVTGFAGFGLSYGLLQLGVWRMWLRYPLAVIGGYLVFLALLRLWVELEQRRFDPSGLNLDQEAESPVPTAGSGRDDRGSWLEWLDAGDLDFGGDAEGCLVGIILGVVIALIVTVVVTLIGAPALLAEVFFDAFLVTALYRRLRIAAHEHWLGTAVRKTWRTALLVAALLSLAGWCLGQLSPDALSIGHALLQYRYR